LLQGGVSSDDQALLALRLNWAIGSDAYLALLEQGVLTQCCDGPSLDDIRNFAPTVLIATVSDALQLTHAAALEHFDLAESSVRLVIVTGEPGGSLPVTRRAIEGRWGAACLDVYAVTELGVVGTSCPARGDCLHLDDSLLHFELLDPDGDGPRAPGELGELAATTPDGWGTPLTNFRTGDLMQLTRGACGCAGRLVVEGGVIGRVRERMLVRGAVLLPSTIEQIVRRHPAVVDFRLRTYLVQGECEVLILVEPSPAIASEGDRARVAAEVSEDVRRSLGMRLPCDLLAPASAATDQDAGRRARRLSRQ
jgi:phenylacetate-CoA ligase